MLSKRMATVFFLTLCLTLGGGAMAMDFSEAPEFAETVDQGELPPVEDRLPVADDVYVLETVEEIGTYGGVARTATIRPEGWGDDTMLLPVYGSLVHPLPGGDGVEPHLAKDFEISDDTTTFTFYLREGLKWSDGEPYTSEDIMFWYEHILLNEDLTPVIGIDWLSEGEVVEITAPDDYTVQFEFVAPEPFFVYSLVHNEITNFPKHYMKQFHPDFVDQDELEQDAADAGFDAWYEYFWDQAQSQGIQPFREDLPTMGPYVLDSATADRRVYSRNPYFWKVDEAGNQLPYFDGLECEIVVDREILNGMIIAGQLDFAGFETDIRNFPMFRQYEEEGNFDTVLWESGMGSEVIYMLNQTIEDPNLREVFQDVRFRRALSLAIDRQEISDVIYHGQAEPRQYTVLDDSQFYKEEYAEAYTDYDPERAEELLDEMGLDETDSEGFRIGPEGDRILFTIEFYDTEVPRGPNVELVAEYWREIGIDARIRSISGELQGERAPANLIEATVWHGDKASDILFPVGNNLVIPKAPGWDESMWPAWGLWFNTDGEEGEEPPEHIKELRGWYDEMVMEPDEDRRLELGDKILRSQAENLWVIGTVGRAPYPLIVSKDMGNVPDWGLWCWDTLWSCTRGPEQFFFRQ